MFNETQSLAGEGVKLVGSPAAMINLMITGEEERKWVTDQLVNEGPLHKQVLSALLINRLIVLVRTLEKWSGTTFIIQDGYALTNKIAGATTKLPITVPINLGPECDKNKIAEIISEAPGNDVLAYAICIQAIEWAINATKKHSDF